MHNKLLLSIKLFMCRIVLSFTLDSPLEKGFTGFTGSNTIVVARGDVTAHKTQPLGYSTKHELTLHLAIVVPKPPGQRQRTQT